MCDICLHTPCLRRCPNNPEDAFLKTIPFDDISEEYDEDIEPEYWE